MRAKNSGFHLIEVVISVAVIAILVQLASPRYSQAQEKSNQLNMLANIAEIQLALEYCYAKNGSYLACKHSDEVDVGAQAYTITLLSPLAKTPCYRWVMTQDNVLNVYGRGGASQLGGYACGVNPPSCP